MRLTLAHKSEIPAHRWHPLAAAVSGVFLIIGLAQSDSLLVIAGLLLFTGVGFILLGVRNAHIFRLFRYFLWMLPVTFFMHLLFTEHGITFLRNMGEGSISLTLVSEAALFTLKIFGFLYIMGGCFQLIRTDRVLDSLSQLARVLQRRQIPVSGVVQIVHLAIRFFPLLQQEAQHLQDVRKGLGIAERQTLTGRIRSQVRSLTPLFIGTLHRGEVLAQTMQLRGFRPESIRTVYQPPVWRSCDTLLVCAAFSITALLIVL
ncbi:MAG TPA: energy-coupling factor transporter transmembrane component T [bacterium]|nr:energy-coupling factor transporter transmembrane component T [bacterium]